MESSVLIKPGLKVNPLYTNGFFFLVLYNKLGIDHYTYQGVSCYDFQNNFIFCLKIFFFILTNSVDPDEMPHYAAFHLGLHCMPKYPFRGFLYTNG